MVNVSLCFDNNVVTTKWACSANQPNFLENKLQTHSIRFYFVQNQRFLPGHPRSHLEALLLALVTAWFLLTLACPKWVLRVAWKLLPLRSDDWVDVFLFNQIGDQTKQFRCRPVEPIKNEFRHSYQCAHMCRTMDLLLHILYPKQNWRRVQASYALWNSSLWLRRPTFPLHPEFNVRQTKHRYLSVRITSPVIHWSYLNSFNKNRLDPVFGSSALRLVSVFVCTSNWDVTVVKHNFQHQSTKVAFVASEITMVSFCIHKKYLLISFKNFLRVELSAKWNQPKLPRSMMRRSPSEVARMNWQLYKKCFPFVDPN